MMKIFQSTSSALLLLLSAAILAPRDSAQAAVPTVVESAPSDQQLISQVGPLRRDSSGAAVTALQQQLTTLGYFSGAITGFFGSFTEDAVIRFQQDAGLTADGIVGAGTDAAIQQRLTPATPAPSSVLRLDDRGEQVSELQRRLTTLGYFTGPISGTFGPLTQDAVIAFQRASNLTADGIVGAGTSDALRRATAPAPVPVNPPASTVLRRGDSGQRVVDLQSRLRQLGFYSGALNGNYGSLTEAAVVAFQRSRGLTEDGVAGPAVLAALERLAPLSANPAAGSGNTAAEPQIRESEGARRMTLTDGDRYSVAELQRRLQSQGLNPGAENGVLTPETRQAIVQAQQEHGLSQSDLPSQ
jgi:peptidoglycan hydrolase-like protein with peptidoglycan-binding domain